jgi:nitrogen regulatory protein P-II 1
MKKITVVIPPVKFDALKKRLIEIGVCGATVSNAEGYGVQKRNLDTLKDKETVVEYLPKIKIEIAVKDEEAEKVILEIIENTRTGRIGDGKIFVSELTDVIRIRTGERRDDAL